MNFGFYYANSARYGDHWPAARRYFGKRLNTFRDWEQGVTPIPRATQSIIAGLNLLDGADPARIRNLITALRSYWPRVLALDLADEPKWKPPETARLLRMVNDEIKHQGLPPRPSTIVYTRDQILSGRNWDVAGIIPGLECYLDYEGEETNATAQRRMQGMISTQLNRVGKRKVLLVGQGYDRNSTYKDKDSLVAIQKPIFDTARRLDAQGRLLALVHFAYARPGGVLAYPAMKAEIKRLLQA